MPVQKFGIQVEADPSQAVRGLGKVTGGINAASSAANRFRQTITRALGVLASGAAFKQAVSVVAQFNKSMAEVSTLVNTATFDLRALEKQALANARAFGSSPLRQTQAFYSIISAGASNAAEASGILNAANRLAIGGVADLGVATDGLTSILNAYGLSAEDAIDVSDALFVAMRGGKTTVGELASSIGQVAPIAASLGVNIDTLLASLSALTKQGISTRVAVTGVRAILAAIAKPSSQATKLAKELGLEFNAAGLQSRGFKGFLDDLLEATQGNTDQLALLFGGVEALSPIMALAGAGAADFANILEQTTNKSGETDAAVQKMSDTFAFQAARILPALQAELIGAGGVLEDLRGIVRFVADNMGRLVDLVKGAGVALVAAFTPRIIVASIVAIRNAVISLNIAMRANPYLAIASAIATVSSLLYAFRNDIANIEVAGVRLGHIFTVIWDDILFNVRRAVAFFRDGWKTGFKDVEGALGLFSRGFKFVIQTLGTIYKGVVNQFVGIWKRFTLTSEYLTEELGTAISNVYNRIHNAIAGFIEGVVRGTGDMIDRVRNGLVGVGNFFIDAFNSGVDAVNNLQGGTRDAVVAIIGYFQNFLFAINDIFTDIANIGIRAANKVIEVWTGVSNQIRQALGLSRSGAAQQGLIDAFGEDRGQALIGDSAALQSERTRLAARIQSLEAQIGGVSPLSGNLDRLDLRARSDSRIAELLEIDKQVDAIDRLLRATESGNGKQEATQFKMLESLRDQGKSLISIDDNGVTQIRRLDRIDAGSGGTFQSFSIGRRDVTDTDAVNARYRQFLDNIQDTFRTDYVGGAVGNVLTEARRRRDHDAFGFQQRGLPANLTPDQASAVEPYLDQLDMIAQKQDEITEKTQSFGEKSKQIYDELSTSLSDGFANSLARSIVYSENLGDSLRNVAKRALADFIAEQIKLQVAQATTAAQSQALAAQTTATTAAAMGAISAAAAPAATLTSLATGGANAVGAQAGISTTAALAKAVSAFRDGTDYVRGGGSSLSDSVLARLSVGEGVVNARGNRNNPGAVAAMNAGETLTRKPPQIDLKVYVSNNFPVDENGNRLSETEVRAIASQEAGRAVVEQSPRIISGEIGRPNSQVTRALKASSNFVTAAR